MADRVIAATLELGRPIPAMGEQVERLDFHEPRGRDITEIGVPCMWQMRDGEPVVTYDAAKMTTMIGRLAQVPPSSIDRLSSHDWMNAAQLVSLFFVPMKAPPISSTSSSTSPSTSLAASPT